MSSKENIFKVVFRRIAIFVRLLTSGFKVALKKPYFQNSIIKSVSILSILINFALWFYLFANKTGDSHPVILHYNLLFGVDYLGAYHKIFFIPFVGLALFLINSVVSYWLYFRERIAVYFLMIAVLEIQIFLFIAGVAIVRINM